MDDTAPFTFIVGSPRSGTTLLRAMLNSHPELAIPPESHFVPRLCSQDGRPFDASDFAARLRSEERFRLWGLAEDVVATSLSEPAATSAPEAIRRIYALYAQQHGKNRFADKTPQYVTEMDELAEYFPESRFVHLIRDGRDVALSILDVPFGSPTLVRAVRRWRDRVTKGRASGKALGPGRYLELRYEDLVADPEPQLRRVCAFMGFDYDERMLRYTEGADDIMVEHPQAHKSVQLPPTVGLRNWREQMRPLDVGACETIAGDLLTELGYPRAFADPRLVHRVEARRQVMVAYPRKVRRRIRRRLSRLRQAARRQLNQP